MPSVALNHTSDYAEPIDDELPPGTSLCQGQYEIVKYLNAGGFGITYLAHDSLGRKVVIKECFPNAICRRSGRQLSLRAPSHQVDFERVVELFEREARALAQLAHPNIVGVHQIFHDNGTAYMALDFVEGLDLHQIVENAPKRLGPYEVRRITIALLTALSYVHRNGILHRDISPDNILMAPDGSPVLIDFGAAREGATRASRILSRLQTVKDGYSPQEFYSAGGPQEICSDLYALAATVHHLITGDPPPNSTTRLAAVAEDRADPYKPLAGRVDGYDQHFLKAIDQCLSVFAKDRLKSADAWLDKIDQTRRQKVLTEQARKDQEIDVTISQMISANQEALAKPDTGDDSDMKWGRRRYTVAVEKPVASPRLAAIGRENRANLDHSVQRPAPETAEPVMDRESFAPPRWRALKRRVTVALVVWALLLTVPFDEVIQGVQVAGILDVVKPGGAN